MIVYDCSVCRNRDGGEYRFAVSYDEADDAEAEATRCPKCGTLADKRDVTIIRQTEETL